MNVLVTGANGQLGREIRIVSMESADRYVFTDVTDLDGADTVRLDITDMSAVRRVVEEYGIDVIVNCAAYTDVDKAETQEELCRKLNADAPGNLALVMKETGGLLIHISTDYVFGGDPYNTPCTEDRTGTPTGVYGRTKLDGEKAVQQTGCRYMIIRTAWLYSEYGRNFVRTMLALTASKPQLNVVFDQVGTPTYALDLARVICGIIEEGKTDGKDGIYHYSNEGACSWYDFAKMIAEYSGHLDCDIRPCHSDEFPSPVRRPAYSVLDKTRIKNAFGITIPHWTDSLKKCLKNI